MQFISRIKEWITLLIKRCLKLIGIDQIKMDSPDIITNGEKQTENSCTHNSNQFALDESNHTSEKTIDGIEEINLVRGFALPHLGSGFGTCQDSLFADANNLFFSVVDGVSEGIGQMYFVKLLSRYKRDQDDVRLRKDDAQFLHGEWRKFQEELIESNRMPPITLGKYMAGMAANSTYIRLKFYKDCASDKILWKCAVLGDSAMIHLNISDDEMEIKHVIMSNENVRNDNCVYSDEEGYYDFSEAPDQIDPEGTWLENEAYLENIMCQKGDIFLLMTDHVSEWILRNANDTKARIKKLLEVQTQDQFQELIDKERRPDPETGVCNMGDDDSTALIVEIVNPSKLGFKVTAIIDPREKYEEEKKMRNKQAVEVEPSSQLDQSLSETNTIGDDRKN